MSNRTAKIALAIAACVVSGAALATLSPGAARGAEDCLAAPKAETPEGGHWHYRIDRDSKRHCWYLRQEDDKLAQPAASNASNSTKPAPSKAETSSQQSIANAHAELPAQTSVEPPVRPSMKPLTQPSTKPLADYAAALPRNAAGNNDAVVPDMQPQRSVVVSRWPEASGTASSSASSSLDPAPAAAQLAENLPENPALPAPAAAVPLAAADSSSQGRPGSIAVLLGVLAGALALAGITASLVFKFAGARPPPRLRRGVNWKPMADERMQLADHTAADVLPRRSGLPRDLDQPDDANERIAEFFAQLSRRAPN